MPSSPRYPDNSPGENGNARRRLVSIGSSDSREYPLDKQTIAIGSHPSNDVVLDGTTVSRRHATITRKPGGFELADLGSTNGTFVNGGRVRKAIALGRGDQIKFGSARFAFIAAGDPIPPARVAGARSRLGRALATIAVMFIAGFAGVRYRNEIGPAASGIAAWISSRRASSAPSAASTQPASADSQAKASSTPALSTPALSPIPAAVEPSALKPNPFASSLATPSVSQQDWIKRLNYYRSLASLSSVTEDQALDDADYKHARYLVKNHSPSDSNAHDEDPNNPWYTPEGLAAAKSSDLIPPCDGCRRLSEQETIDGWVTVPFHRFIILNPNLRTVGYGEFHEKDLSAYVLSLPAYPPSERLNPPILFPPDHASISLSAVKGEWPSPTASCNGYVEPTGLPITMTFGGGGATVSSHSLKVGNSEVEHCVLDANSYSNPDPVQAEWGKRSLKFFGGVVIIPRYPLASGAKYSVSITVNGKQYDWTFSTHP